MGDPWALRPAAYHTAPAYEFTFGPQVSSLGDQVGFVPDPEQRLILDDIFGVDSEGLSTAYESAVVATRQQLKTGVMKLAVLGWSYVLEVETVTWSAHLFSTTEEAFRDLGAMCENVPILRKRLAKGPTHGIHGARGSEHIEFADGRRIMFKARTLAGGRGLTGDKMALDEALYLKPEHLGSLSPTLTAVEDPQILYGGSAGLAGSAIWRGIRDRGRAGSPSLAYWEFCARWRPCATDACEHWPPSHPRHRPGCALDDEEAWAEASPLLGRRRPNGTGLTLKKMRKFRDSEPPDEFARERLGRWEEDGADEIFGPGRWAACKGDADGASRGAIGVAVAEDLSSASIGGAGFLDGRVAVRPLRVGPKIQWVVQAVLDILAEQKVPVVVDGRGPAAAIAKKLRQVLGGRLVVAKPDECLDAFAELHEMVTGGVLLHEDYPELNASIKGATTRNVGDRRALARRASTSDIAPAEAVMLAAWYVRRPKPVPLQAPRPERAELGRHELEMIGF